MLFRSPDQKNDGTKKDADATAKKDDIAADDKKDETEVIEEEKIEYESFEEARERLLDILIDEEVSAVLEKRIDSAVDTINAKRRRLRELLEAGDKAGFRAECGTYRAGQKDLDVVLPSKADREQYDTAINQKSAEIGRAHV